MKTILRAPFFEIGVKNYIYGNAVLELAKAADQAAEEFDIDVLFVAPYTDIWRVSQNTQRLIVLAPYMDTLYPGRGVADVLPEALAAAGAKGVMLNHCERPMPPCILKKAIQRANELDMLTFVCAGSIEEAQAVAHFHPDIINPEPPELIGTGKSVNMEFVKESIAAIKHIDPNIFVEQAAGITTGKQVYNYIFAGADAAGAASGIVKASSPCNMAREMIRSVRQAWDDRNHSGLIYATPEDLKICDRRIDL